MTTQVHRAANHLSWTPGRSTRTPASRGAGPQPVVLEHVVAIKLLVDRYRARTLLDMGAGMTILLVEQNVATALSIAQRVYVLEEGRIVAEGSPEAMMSRAEIRRAFLGEGLGASTAN